MLRLRAAGCVFAEDEAALLQEAAATPADLERLVGARVRGVPLEHLVGWVDFHGLRIGVGPGVFVPRQRTTLMVDEAIRLARPDCVLVDLCCGSGAVGAAVLAAVPDVELHASDIDPVAVRWARSNLPASRVHRGELFAGLPRDLRGRVDVLTCNAPYVPTDAVALMPPEARDHEPLRTLDGGTDGLAVIRRVVAEAGDWLAPGGALLFEVGESQAAAAGVLVELAGLTPSVVRRRELGAAVVIGTARSTGQNDGGAGHGPDGAR